MEFVYPSSGKIYASPRRDRESTFIIYPLQHELVLLGSTRMACDFRSLKNVPFPVNREKASMCHQTDKEMNPEKEPAIVPEQKTGKEIDATASVLLANDTVAREYFTTAVNRLQTVREWATLAGEPSAEFALTDAEGNVVDRPVQKGDYLKIKIPGPGNPAGDGYDWVRIEEVEIMSSEDTNRYAFRVRPARNPSEPQSSVAHFYSEDSTSTFSVTRDKNVVTAAIFDRNTKPNTESDSAAGKVRDALVGTAGIVAFSRIQWQNLVNGLLKRDD